jgi:hypothetical protein
MQTLEEFLAGSEVSLRCREINPNGDEEFLTTAPWSAARYRRELDRVNGNQTITTIVGSDDGSRRCWRYWTRSRPRQRSSTRPAARSTERSDGL